MNSRLRLLLILALVTLGLAAVNPGLEEFSAYILKQRAAPADSADPSIRNMMTGISKDALAVALKDGVVRKDYVVFSLFEISNPREDRIHKILGFGKKIFIPLNESPKWSELKTDF